MRRRRRIALGAACPVTTVHTKVYRGADEQISAVDFDLRIAGTRTKIGHLATDLSEGRYAVISTSINDEQHRRCGLGTKLYTAAATWGCAHGLSLESDSVRSADSHGFWTKQERKGRAKCTGPSSELPRDDKPGPRYGRDGCETYRLTTCARPVDLSGRRRR